MKFIDMNTLSREQLRQAARILAQELPLGWESTELAMEMLEKKELIPENTCIAAIEENNVIGWGGILPSYDGRVYELHPLVVRHDRQRMGVGGMLLRALEDAARERGGVTMWLGADDEKPGGETSLANADLYDDLPGRLRTFEPGTHQTAFYLRQGFRLIGVMPDANGDGKPDIFMGRRL